MNTNGPLIGTGGQADVTHGHHYRAVVRLPLIACEMPSLATDKLEGAGFGDIVVDDADHLPADWPPDRVTYGTADLECLRYIEGTYNGPSTSIAVPSQVVALWEYSTPEPLAPPPGTTPGTPGTPPAPAPGASPGPLDPTAHPYVAAGITAFVGALATAAAVAIAHAVGKNAEPHRRSNPTTYCIGWAVRRDLMFMAEGRREQAAIQRLYDCRGTAEDVHVAAELYRRAGEGANAKSMLDMLEAHDR